MATPGSDGKNDFPGATPIFDHEHAPASVQAGSRRARFSPPMGWQRGRARRGDGAVPRAGRLPDPRTAMSIHGHMMVPSPGGADVSGSMRSLLRASTAGLHAVVDARFAPMLDAGEAGYRSFLLASAAAVFPLEQALLTAGVDLLLPDWTRPNPRRGPARRSHRSRHHRRRARDSAAARGSGRHVRHALCPRRIPARRQAAGP
jgi:hypothetical protein